MAVDLESLLSARPAESAERGRLALGQIVDGWRVEAYLGSGRSSEVYRVMSTRFGGEGALKLLVDDTHGLRERFLREMEVLRSLPIPSLPRYFGCGRLAGRPYFVMEYLQPLFLPLDRSEVVPFMSRLANEVGALHAAGYLHRDLKPANILRRRDGTPALIDLGLVRKIGERGTDGVGTKGYAAPEQLLEGVATVRADVFSLGKLLKAAGGKQLGPRLRAVARRAAAEDPADRYPTAAAFARALEGHKSRNALLVALIFAIVLILSLFAYFLHHPKGPVPTQTGPVPIAVGPVPIAVRSVPVSAPAQTGPVPMPEGPVPVPEGSVPAVERLVQEAEACFHGLGGETNLVEAVRLYRLAAEDGHLGAMDSLGLCLLKGLGCEADPEAAFAWFKAAAEKDHPSAMNNLAFCYMNGKGTARDEHKGFVWAEEAARLGHVPSETMVGECYLDGRGVAADRERALIWLRRAARHGNRRASLLLGDLQH